MSRKNDQPAAMVKVPEDVKRYLEGMASDSRKSIEAFLQSVLAQASELNVYDLWEPRDFAATYWILLISGVNQSEEMEIANALLFWKTFLAKHSAQVLCLQASDRDEFRCCSSTFGVVNCPTLIFSDSPDLIGFVKVEPQLLFSLAAQKGGLQRFFTKIHSLVENGDSIVEVQVMLDNEKFWSSLKLVYSEVKSLVSFKKDL